MSSVMEGNAKGDLSLPHADRKFYDLPSTRQHSTTDPPSSLNVDRTQELFSYIRENIVGRDKIFSGPFGLRKVIYCDYTASGRLVQLVYSANFDRSLQFIEDYIAKEVLPEYGNTHTTTTVTSLQTTLFRHEARDIVRNAVNASEHDAVVFVGSGCTAAVHKLIHALHLTQPPVVFVSPYEHHSNLLPWREMGSEMVRVAETTDGRVDVHNLEQELEKYHGSERQLIGCFAAASNITGTLVEVDAITMCLHGHRALALWDYATAAPYVSIDMNPVTTSCQWKSELAPCRSWEAYLKCQESSRYGQCDQMKDNGEQSLVYKDAVFLSTHKFIGGVQTPGILIAKKKLFKNPVPSDGGGGSVFFVRRDSHRYLQETEMREEGGTPAVVESVRAGLVFQLKEAIGTAAIMCREEQLCRKALDHWAATRNLVLLGSLTAPRLPIFSFLVRHAGSGRFLHHNFTCALLNDMFGVQARGGCACAGPYAEDLLGIDEKLAEEYERLLAEDSRLDRVHLRRYREYSEREILRPGFVRLNLPYFFDDDSVDFVLEAVRLVAEFGWLLLPQYKFNPETGEWRQTSHQVFKDRKWLGHVSYQTGRMSYAEPARQQTGPLPADHQDCLQKAREVFAQAAKTRVSIADQTVMFDEASAKLRWFLLPSEAQECIQTPAESARRGPVKVPFEPVKYPLAGSRGGGVMYLTSAALAPPSGEPRKHDVDKVVSSRRLFKEGFREILSAGFDTETKTEEKEEKGHIVDIEGTSRNIDKGDTNSYDIRNSDHSRDDDTCCRENSGVGSLEKSGVKISQEETPEDGFSEMEVGESSQVGSNETQDTDLGKERGSSFAEGDRSREHGSVSVDTCSDPDRTGQHLAPTVRSSQDCRDCQTNKPSGSILTTDLQPSDPVTGPDSKKAKPGHRWHAPPKDIFKPFLEAMQEFNMIETGDRVLVCLSGGKDSLSLLHTVRQYQFYARKKGVAFQFGAVTVDPQTSSYDPSPLKGYLAQLGVPYFFEQQGIMETAQSLPYECASICSFCSRMKRGRIYHAARREGYNVLALGQHLDDLAESFLMSVFHNGALRTMKANYTVKEGDLRVTRPLVYVRESDLRRFAEGTKLPVISENCPACFEAPKERHRMKQLLASQEVLHPKVFPSISAAIRPLMGIGRTGVDIKTLLGQLMGGGEGEEGEEEERYL